LPSARTLLISAMQYDAELRTGGLSSVDVIQTAKKLGVDGVELRDVYWKRKERELPEARSALVELGLIGTYATFVTLFDLSAKANADEVRSAVDDAAALGSPIVRIFPGKIPQPEDVAAWHAAGRAIEYASKRGVIIALENFAQTPGCRLEEVNSVLERIRSSALGTNLDIGNYASNGEDVVAAVRTLGSRIVSSHLKDVVSTLTGHSSTFLGDGNLPLAEIMAEFDRLPQRILHCFEFGGGGNPEERIRKSLVALNSL